MGRKTLVGMVTGVMLMIALVSAACSGGTPNAAASPDSEVVKRSIKVFESPT
jgi:ABC-type glycerol-3-phosphate transport system substrate-binding protein